jgi:hypothetical protein
MKSSTLVACLLALSFGLLLSLGRAVAAPSADPPPGHPAWHSDAAHPEHVLALPATFDPIDPGRAG